MLRADSAESKVTAEGKMTEACSMLENAQNKFAEAEAKARSAELLEAEASRFRRMAERKLQEVEEREDDLRRCTMSFKSEYVYFRVVPPLAFFVLLTDISFAAVPLNRFLVCEMSFCASFNSSIIILEVFCSIDLMATVFQKCVNIRCVNLSSPLS